jgi:transcriptional regulator with XRE-family HTH domain
MTIHAAQEQLRGLLQRRIERGTMSVTLLSRKTGLGQSHVSNWLHAKRNLSIAALDAIMRALEMDTELLPITRRALEHPTTGPGRAPRLPVAAVTPEEWSGPSRAGRAVLRVARGLR